MNLLANMDLKNTMIKILAKANFVIAFIYPQAKACGNSKACDNSYFYINFNWNAALAHSIINYQNPFGFSQNINKAII